MASYLVTGSSRGLGLALVTLLAARPIDKVGFIAATARNETPALRQLTEKYPGRVVFVPLETTSKESIAAAVKKVEDALGEGKGLDILVNNAGILTMFPGGISEMDDLMNLMNVNVNGVHMVTVAFLPLLRKGNAKTVVNITSTLGSIAWASSFAASPASSYKTSKAALNMLTVLWSQDLAKEGFTFALVSPGWLKTDLGSEAADLPVETGANATMAIIDKLGKGDNGKFFDIEVPGFSEGRTYNLYLGGEVPW